VILAVSLQTLTKATGTLSTYKQHRRVIDPSGVARTAKARLCAGNGSAMSNAKNDLPEPGAP